MSSYHIKILVAILIIVGIFMYGSQNNISKKDLVSLKQDCADQAEKFAAKLKKENILSTYTVVHSTYNDEYQSCFAELTRSEKDLGEFYIYDTLSGKEMAALTVFSKFNKQNKEEDFEYIRKSTPKYFNIRKNIFGLEKNEI